MSENGTRYLYRGHAIGVSAQFDRLGKLEGLNHVIPALGAAVLPVTGGLSHSHVDRFDYPVVHPCKQNLISVRRVESRATGRKKTDGFHTEVQSRVEDLSILDKVHFGLVEFHLSSEKLTGQPTQIFSKGNKIEGMRLADVAVHVELDQEMLAKCGTKEELARYYAEKAEEDDDFAAKQAWRFGSAPGARQIQDHDGYYYVTLVRRISLGEGKEKLGLKDPTENMIQWSEFGKIFLAEVIVGERDRRITMARLEMGSPAAGSGSVGDGSTNGSIST